MMVPYIHSKTPKEVTFFFLNTQVALGSYCCCLCINAQRDEKQEGNDEKLIGPNTPNARDTHHQTWTESPQRHKKHIYIN
jgi:hypothetical protein